MRYLPDSHGNAIEEPPVDLAGHRAALVEITYWRRRLARGSFLTGKQNYNIILERIKFLADHWRIK